ncbi:MAG TPA: AAA family ATPase [Candidatus Moranbacteria bacterium]|nr:AAA family ATPase [Candidatus Moranbacteria bacterium]
MKIIGITGTLGAGKGTIVEFLKEKGFRHFSARDFLVKEIKKRGLEVNRDSMTMVGNDLREKNKPSYIIDELYGEAKKGTQNCVIESIRTAGEVESLRKKGAFTLLAVDADQKTRYERIIKRDSATDKISFEKFQSDEEREMESEDPNKQNLLACRRLADFVIFNNGTMEELREKVEEVLDKID